MKPKSLPLFTTVRAALLAAVSSTISFAADGTWNVDTSTNWSTASSWSSNTIADGSGFTANFTNNITADRTVTLDTARTIGNIVFSDANTSTAGSWLISGANVLTLAGTTPTITVNALGTNKTATISSVITGVDGLKKDGVGTLVLTGANTYTGATTISAGTLQLGDGTTNPTLNSTYNISDSTATLRVKYNSSGVDIDPITAGQQSWTSTTWSKFTGAGTLALATGKTASDLGWGTAALGAGFTGTLQIESGRVTANGSASLGGATNVVVKAGGQFLALNGTAFGQAITLSGDGAGESGQPGALRVGGGHAATFTNTITLAADAGINSQTSTSVMTISGGITGNFGITKHNAGLLTLQGSNTYTGATIVNSGQLTLDYTTNNTSKVSLTAALTLAPGATLQFTGNTTADTSQSIKGLTLSGSGGLHDFRRHSDRQDSNRRLQRQQRHAHTDECYP